MYLFMYILIYLRAYVCIYFFIILFRPKFPGMKLESKTLKAIHCCGSAERKHST